MTQKLELANEFEALPSDTGRWQWLKNNQRRHIMLFIDNGCYIQFNDGTKAYFDFCLEWSPGTFALLEAYGIKVNQVTDNVITMDEEESE